jgi:hypothetical protein
LAQAAGIDAPVEQSRLKGLLDLGHGVQHPGLTFTGTVSAPRWLLAPFVTAEIGVGLTPIGGIRFAIVWVMSSADSNHWPGPTPDPAAGLPAV